MSKVGLSSVVLRSPLENEWIATEKLSKACEALRNVFPGIRSQCNAGPSESHVIFSLSDSEDLKRLACFIHGAAMHPASVFRPDEASKPAPKKIIYNPPATIVLWADGTKTVVKCSDEDAYAPEVGFLWALAEKVYGSKSQVEKVMNENAHFIC